jgi:hypothetical protein
MTANAARAGSSRMTGARRRQAAPRGQDVLLQEQLQDVRDRLEQPVGPTRRGPSRTCMKAITFRFRAARGTRHPSRTETTIPIWTAGTTTKWSTLSLMRPSAVHAAEHDVERSDERHHVRHHVAAAELRQGLQVHEAGAEPAAIGVLTAVADDVDAQLAPRPSFAW